MLVSNVPNYRITHSLDRAFASDKAPTLPSALYRACEPVIEGLQGLARTSPCDQTGQSNMPGPQRPSVFSFLPLTERPALRLHRMEAFWKPSWFLLVPKFAMLWRKGLARFMASALHFARFPLVSALATARRGTAQPENRGAPGPLLKLDAHPRLEPCRAEAAKTQCYIQHGRITVSDVFCSVLHATVLRTLRLLRQGIPFLNADNPYSDRLAIVSFFSSFSLQSARSCIRACVIFAVSHMYCESHSRHAGSYSRKRKKK